MITRLKNVYLAVEDVPAAAGFYADLLGIEPEFVDGERWAQFRLGGRVVALAGAGETAVAAPSTQIVFAADAPEDHDAILALGAVALGERDMGDHGTLRSYRDPQGVIFECWWPAGTDI